ncbi:MAG: tRNA pseudouridine(38-40) synthase TruA [Bacteroidia bacterium]|nr:tRNA pseudouridine(38-40) synthase TruA [Bacteroidia bacterium]
MERFGMRYLATVKYNGTRFQGWQRQPNVDTIQGSIESVLSQLLNKETMIFGSGRTDAGVHALGQTFHFDTDKEIEDLSKLRYAMNRLLSRDIHLVDIIKVADDFHARLSAKAKTYQYIVNTGEDDPFNVDFKYFYPRELDINAMRKAAALFQGRHDFRNFTSKEEDDNGFVREIYAMNISTPQDHVIFDLQGNGFMRYMVRMIVGTLLEIGMGRFSVEETRRLLDNPDRDFVNYKAPPNGLYLVKVDY